MKTKSLYLLVLWCVMACAAGAQQFTTQVIPLNGAITYTNEVGTNQVLEILSYRFDSLCSMQVTSGGNSVTFGLASLQSSVPRIAGPATLLYRGTNGANGGGSYITFKVSDKDAGFTPSTAVVIPTDAAGPVEIVLESSTDLVSWTAAVPGTYGVATEKRFFRVRAVKP